MNQLQFAWISDCLTPNPLSKFEIASVLVLFNFVTLVFLKEEDATEFKMILSWCLFANTVKPVLFVFVAVLIMVLSPFATFDADIFANVFQFLNLVPADAFFNDALVLKLMLFVCSAFCSEAVESAFCSVPVWSLCLSVLSLVP